MDLILAGTQSLLRADGTPSAGAGINSPAGWLMAAGLVVVLGLVAWWASGRRDR